ncbi:MAG: Gfo/Idh/MocA family oxidoreductase [Clostridiales bacterium]|nr:Gfo/Idh/MocA family oxidoreductase [Clostridiales bacterium]
MEHGKELRIGLVGCGNIGRTHMRALTQIPGACLAAVSDVSEAAACAAAREYGCRSFADFRDMIDSGEIDVVDICTPTGMRRDIAVYAAQRGKHIVAEKPLEISTRRIDDMLAAADQNHVTVHGILGKRYADLYGWLRDAVNRGRLGELFFADIAMKWYRPPAYYENTWRGTWALDGGGALMNQCIHYVDLMQWFMGMPVSVFAYTGRFAHPNIETEDTAAVLLRFHGGGIGVIQASTAMNPGFSARFSLHGREGGIILEDDRIMDFQPKAPADGDQEALERFGGRAGRKVNVFTHVVSDHELHRRQLADIA